MKVDREVARRFGFSQTRYERRQIEPRSEARKSIATVTYAREEDGISNIFSPDYLRTFSQMQYADSATAARSFIFLFVPATHLRGEKRVARPPGISSDILFMKHLIYTGA